jgi:uracil-DNA glycosylase
MKPLQAFELLKSAEKKYNFSDGFKLLYCPWDNISSSNIAFISLNPGNAPENAELRMISDERGNSYEIEMDITKSPINEQFMKLCDFLENKPSDFLTGAAIPFRSKNWESLNKEQKIAGVEIGVSLWKELLGSNVKKIIVTGEEACKTVLKIKSAELKLSIPSKWGNSYLKKYVATDETEIFSIPHLSRYRLFSRKESIKQLEILFNMNKTNKTTLEKTYTMPKNETIEYRPNDRFKRSDKVINSRCKPHNIARWEWIGLDGKKFSEIDARNSEYRKHTANGVKKFILNESPISSHLDYDIKSEYIDYIKSK